MRPSTFGMTKRSVSESWTRIHEINFPLHQFQSITFKRIKLDFPYFRSDRYSCTFLSALTVHGLHVHCSSCQIFQGQARLCVGWSCSWSRCSLRRSDRRHPLQSGGGLVLLEPGPHLEGGTLYEKTTRGEVLSLWMYLPSMNASSLRGSGSGSVDQPAQHQRSEIITFLLFSALLFDVGHFYSELLPLWD